MADQLESDICRRPTFEDIDVSPTSEFVLVHNAPKEGGSSGCYSTLCLLTEIPRSEFLETCGSYSVAGCQFASIDAGPVEPCNKAFKVSGSVVGIERSPFEVVVKYTDRAVTIEPTPSA